MKPLLAALCLIVAAGCACPFAGSRQPACPRPGEILSQEYQAIPATRECGQIAVVFAPGSPPVPTRWYLLGAAETRHPRPVTAAGAPQRPVTLHADTYALMLELDPKYAAIHPGAPAPEPRMITLIEKQLLVVTISYGRP